MAKGKRRRRLAVAGFREQLFDARTCTADDIIAFRDVAQRVAHFCALPRLQRLVSSAIVTPDGRRARAREMKMRERREELSRVFSGDKL